MITESKKENEAVNAVGCGGSILAAFQTPLRIALK
jgi:hypothetical protein